MQNIDKTKRKISNTTKTNESLPSEILFEDNDDFNSDEEDEDIRRRKTNDLVRYFIKHC